MSCVGSNFVRGFGVRDFWMVRSSGSEGFEVQFIQIWAWVQPISSQTGSKFGLFRGVRLDLKFGFGGQSWVRVSSKFDPSSSKQFEVRYIWVQSNTSVNFEIPTYSRCIVHLGQRLVST